MNPKPYLIAYLDTYAFSSLSQDFSLSDLISKIIELNKRIKEIIKHKNISLRIFSDFVFISYDLSTHVELLDRTFSSNDEENVRKAIITFVDTLKKCYGEYLEKDLLLRGGISFGKVIISGNTLIGEAVSNAVRLEENGAAPLILFPAFILDKLTSPGWPGIIDIPIKNGRIISAAAILPSDTKKFLNLLSKMRNKECYEMSQYSGVLDKAFNISKMVVNSYNL